MDENKTNQTSMDKITDSDDYLDYDSESKEESPIESLLTGSAATAEYTDNPEAFAKAARKKCFGLAKAWHISAVVSSLAFIVFGIVAASITENGLTFFVYLIAAFFAYMISETIAAVINWLVSKK